MDLEGAGEQKAKTIAHEKIAQQIANNEQFYVVLWDVSKTLNKVWVEGMQYKITELQLPDTITKLFNNFLVNRKANENENYPFIHNTQTLRKIS